MAWSSPGFFCADAVLMGAYNGAVDHRAFIVGIGGEEAEDPLPDAGFRPSAEAAMHVDRVTEAFGQVAPGNAGAITIQDRLDEQAIVRRGHADGARAAGQPVLDPVPLVIAESISVHRSVPERLTTHEPKNAPRRDRVSGQPERFSAGVANETHSSAPSKPNPMAKVN